MKSIFIIIIFLICSITANSQVGIGTTIPDASSMLDITAIDKGLLIPRVSLLSTSDVTTITTPAISLLVYNSGFSPNGYYYFNGTIWVQLGVAASASSDWTIFGNTNIVDGTNFLGTGASTNIDVAFRRNNLAAGKIGASSTSFGVGALSNGAATDGTAFGFNAMSANTTGSNNVAFGNGALSSNITGANNTAVGKSALAVNTASDNTAVGFNTLKVNTSGTTNTAIGSGVLALNVTGIQNTGVGHLALTANTGSASTAIGFEALKANTSGNNGTAVGFQALSKNVAASNNTAIGFQSMLNNTTGNENTALGFQASSIGASGSKNTAVGHIALNNNIGSENTAIGHSSMSGINSNASRFNTAIGFQSMFAGTGNVSNVVAVGANALFQNTASNTVGIGYNALQGQAAGGTGNTGIGYSVLNNNSTGDNNTAVGFEAGFAAIGSGNTVIGYRAGQFASNTTGAGTFVGFQAGQNTTGPSNTAVGNNALAATGASTNSVAVGANALQVNTATSNTAVGFGSLIANVNGTANVALGNQAGAAETGSNKLYISNSNTSATTSLIYGEFSPANILRTNGTFQIGNPLGTGYVFPVARGTNQQVLTTDTSGILSWATPAAEIDPQVSSVTTNAVPKWNGTTLVDSIITDDGTTATVAGNLKSTNFQMTNGAVANYVLQSDATGNATWAAPNNSFSSVRTNLASNQPLTTSGWQKINFATEVYDSNSEFATGTFMATKAGNYNVNAGYHTNSLASAQFYSIGVYVNGNLYQQTSSNHFGNGPVSRNINCNVNLLVGGTIEIYIENYENSVNIDSFSGKTFFEVQQNK